MTAEWVIHGNIKVPYNLNDTARRYKLGAKESIVSTLIKLKVCPSVIPRSWLLRYCDIDVDLCHKIFLAQSPRIDEEDLWHIILQRNLVVPVLADIEKQGLQLDKEAVYEEYETLTAKVESLGVELDGITGGINLGSPKQLQVLLYDTLGFEYPRDNAGELIQTPKGDPSTAAPALARLEATTELQVRFLTLYKEYNNAVSMLEKNLNFFKLVCDERDGVFYGQLNHCRTANHRLASSGVKVPFKAVKRELAAQIQNLPRQYKRLFTAHKKGYVVSEYDGSQIEFRVGGDISGDKRIESDIVGGVDIHTRTMNTMNAAYNKYKIAKNIDRQGAKPNTFAPII
jgi:DNA polymerase-1